jgi:hypothetical protein
MTDITHIIVYPAEDMVIIRAGMRSRDEDLHRSDGIIRPA